MTHRHLPLSNEEEQERCEQMRMRGFAPLTTIHFGREYTRLEPAEDVVDFALGSVSFQAAALEWDEKQIRRLGLDVTKREGVESS